MGISTNTSNVNLLDRLKSIELDEAFVSEIKEIYQTFPIVANLRCGSWYHRYFDDTCYFKSTDGHKGQWQLNHRRLNLHLLDSIKNHGGILIVDSTGRGKALPDSFSKTIPIWAAVCSRVAAHLRAEDSESTWGKLYTPPSSVSRSEHADIEARLEGWTSTLLNSHVDCVRVGRLLDKPLKPLWITPQSRMFLNMIPDYREFPFYPIVCICASHQNPARAMASFQYLPGAGDDEETWARGMTAQTFWKNSNQILALPAAQATSLIDNLVVAETRLTNLAVGGRRAGRPPECWDVFDAVINVTPEEYPQDCGGREDIMYFHMPVLEGKKDKHELERLLPAALRFAYAQLSRNRRLLIHCAQGRDRSVAVAMAILASFYSAECICMPDPLLSDSDCSDMKLKMHLMQKIENRSVLDRCFQWIIASRPIASPTRHTLKKLHRFFFE